MSEVGGGKTGARWIRRAAMAGGIVATLVGSSVAWLTGGRFVGTDNAYVRSAKLMVTTDVSGIVRSVDVRPGEYVEAGRVLFQLDPTPFRIALDAADATLEQAAMELAAAKAGYRSLQEQIKAREAQSRLAAATFERYRILARTRAVSDERFDQAEEARLTAESALSALRQDAAAAAAKLLGDPNLPLELWPPRKKAVAARDEAARQLDHTQVRAPFAGVVSEVDNLRPGMLINSALSSLSTTSAIGLVSRDDVWITADMRETDLTRVREGDPVDVTVDAYPDRHWNGRVAAISQASDSAFSILPQENSSANWVKVVQRIPVRVEIERKADDPPLRVGMSAVVEIDTHRNRGQRLFQGE